MVITEVLRSALNSCLEEMQWPWPEKTIIEPAKDPKHGDLSTNIAMLLARSVHKNPREIAEILCVRLQEISPFIEHCEAKGPGFCNVFFAPSFWHSVIQETENGQEEYGKSDEGRDKKVLVEFVSANPTGPLHIGHGRGAAVGDSLAKLLRTQGYQVDTEYYVNDAGRQMRLLGLSVWLRARELRNLPVTFPEQYYKGSYIIDIARDLLDIEPDLLSLDDDEAKERCYAYAMNTIMDGIKKDLDDFRVHQDRFFSEKTLVESGAVARAFQALDKRQLTYEEDNAYWFATKSMGDDRDRVLRKSDGSLTYFASDIAYHHDKYERGYDWLVDVWGADHHGYIPRMRAAISAMGKDQSSFDVILIQLVNLIKEGKPLSMSTRAGTFETLADVVAEVGTDAARFMFLSRKSDSSLDFDLDLVRQRNLENPVYYVQYAHARIHGLLRRAGERGMTLQSVTDERILKSLTDPQDLALLKKAAQYPDVLRGAARTLGVHHVSHYLMELAGMIHSYYANQPVLAGDDETLILARLALLRALGVVIHNGLAVLGVEAPEQML